MSNIQGVVFDLDGTLFDTGSLIYDTYCHLAEYFGHDTPTRDEVALQMGKPIPEIFAALFPGVDVDTLMEVNSEFIMKRTASVAAYNGLEHMLEQLAGMQLTLGILTSGKDKVYKLLDEHGLRHHFVSIVHADRVSKHKPDPEGLVLASQEMGIGVESIVMVGDMRPDIEVAKNAGAFASIGVTHGFSTREQLSAYGADMVIDTLGELPDAIGHLEARRDT